jgi:hypothetical protein
MIPADRYSIYWYRHPTRWYRHPTRWHRHPTRRDRHPARRYRYPARRDRHPARRYRYPARRDRHEIRYSYRSLRGFPRRVSCRLCQYEYSSQSSLQTYIRPNTERLREYSFICAEICIICIDFIFSHHFLMSTPTPFEVEVLQSLKGIKSDISDIKSDI